MDERNGFAGGQAAACWLVVMDTEITGLYQSQVVCQLLNGLLFTWAAKSQKQLCLAWASAMPPVLVEYLMSRKTLCFSVGQVEVE